MKKSIEKVDGFGSARLTVEHPHDDLYLYLRVSGAYFMLVSFIVGVFSGIGITCLIYNMFF